MSTFLPSNTQTSALRLLSNEGAYLSWDGAQAGSISAIPEAHGFEAVIRTATCHALLDRRWIERPDSEAGKDAPWRWEITAAGRLVLQRQASGNVGGFVIVE
ncbi:hypothetical protein LCGC14_1537230 [marine sediment metagenome]|uniref:Uncharacterized protein n=1 Tax=marine sediment metagenome TaxID=412755 RepID=A0A0F9JF32_9ZZZZ